MVQVNVGKHRTDNPALWAPREGMDYLAVFFHNFRLKPLPYQTQERFIINPQLQHFRQPIMVDIVEEGFDVHLDDPPHRTGEAMSQVIQRLVRPKLGAISKVEVLELASVKGA